jgi:prepilin-type N-terminal cleavage/methylation domain-containing protein
VYYFLLFSPMQTTSKGFTLVELMIVIAIIGILAAALFPSLTAYLAKGRDTARAANVKEIVTALSTALVDQNGVAPASSTTNCADLSGALQTYLPKFPKDPIATGRGVTNCGTQGFYGYGTGVVNGQNSTAVSAVFESASGGITNTGVSSYQGGNVTTLGQIDGMVK